MLTLLFELRKSDIMKQKSTSYGKSSLQRLLHNYMKPIIGLLLVILSAGKVSAQTYIDFQFQPSTTTLTLNQTFTVDVNVHFNPASPTNTINQLDASVNFNNVDLEVLSITTPNTALLPTEVRNNFNAAAGLGGSIANVNTGGADAGKIKYTSGRLGPTGHPNADFVVLHITFRVRPASAANSTLVFDTAPTNPTDVAEAGISRLNAAPGSITPLTLNILACTPPTATLAATPSAPCNGAPFNLVLQSATGTGPYNLVVNGTTYSGINVGNNIITGVTQPTASLFPNGAPPAGITAADVDNAAPIELGMKFSSDVSGYIRGVRFYVGANVTGTFIGNLWSYSGGTTPTGSKLATATFGALTPNSWNTVSFASPVLITANTTYIVSYVTPRYYAYADNYFYSGETNGHLSAPAAPVQGVTPVSQATGVINDPPSNPYFADGARFGRNYFADVVFQENVSTFNLTNVTDATCTNSGALQTLTVTGISGCSTLPVTLLNFAANANGNKVTLKWTTSSESNNKGFDIQRSITANSNDWQTIGFVAGAGTTTIAKDYSYVDANLAPQRYYYRLKQIDTDNNFKLSSTVSATVNGTIAYSLEQNFPNPFRRESTTIRFTLPHAESVNLSVYDLNGRLIKVLVNGTKDAGTHVIPFDAGAINSGVYYYKIQAGDFSAVKKMTIQ